MGFRKLLHAYWFRSSVLTVCCYSYCSSLYSFSFFTFPSFTWPFFLKGKKTRKERWSLCRERKRVKEKIPLGYKVWSSFDSERMNVKRIWSEREEERKTEWGFEKRGGTVQNFVSFFFFS